MEQIDLDVRCVLRERMWRPDGYENGRQFAVREHTGVWTTAMLVDGQWMNMEGRQINKDSVSHWAELPE